MRVRRRQKTYSNNVCAKGNLNLKGWVRSTLGSIAQARRRGKGVVQLCNEQRQQRWFTYSII